MTSPIESSSGDLGSHIPETDFFKYEGRNWRFPKNIYSRKTVEAFLENLAGADGSLSLRLALHPKFPREAFEMLLETHFFEKIVSLGDPNILKVLAINHRTPDHILDLIAESDDLQTRTGLIFNPNLTLKTFILFAKSQEDSLLRCLARTTRGLDGGPGSRTQITWGENSNFGTAVIAEGSERLRAFKMISDVRSGKKYSGKNPVEFCHESNLSGLNDFEKFFYSSLVVKFLNDWIADADWNETTAPVRFQVSDSSLEEILNILKWATIKTNQLKSFDEKRRLYLKSSKSSEDKWIWRFSLRKILGELNKEFLVGLNENFLYSFQMAKIYLLDLEPLGFEVAKNVAPLEIYDYIEVNSI